MNPVGALTFSILKIHFKIIPPYVPRSLRRSLPVRCTKKSQYKFDLPYACHMPCPYRPWFCHLSNIWRGSQFIAIIFLHLLGLCKVSLLRFPPHKSARSLSSWYCLQERKNGEFSGRGRREFVVGPTWQGEHPTVLMDLWVNDQLDAQLRYIISLLL